MYSFVYESVRKIFDPNTAPVTTRKYDSPDVKTVRTGAQPSFRLSYDYQRNPTASN
jgi:hypothetical protein